MTCHAVTPEELEARIEHAYQQLVAETTPDGQQLRFAEMRALVARRTAETILRMEREKGLVA